MQWTKHMMFEPRKTPYQRVPSPKNLYMQESLPYMSKKKKKTETIQQFYTYSHDFLFTLAKAQNYTFSTIP